MGEPRQQHLALKRFVIGLSLAAAVFAVYRPVLRYSFVNFDDLGYIIQNRHIQHGFTADDLRWAFTSFYAGNWHPITWLSHTLDWQLFHLGSGGHHLTNITIHAANSVLLFVVLLAAVRSAETSNSKFQTSGNLQNPSSTSPSENILTRQPVFWMCAFVAAVFALHPMHVESVAWIAERKDVLSTFFFLLTIWAYVRYAQRNRLNGLTELNGVKGTTASSSDEVGAHSRQARRTGSTAGTEPVWPGRTAATWYGLALAFFALGLMSKPMLVTTPFVLLLLDFWPLARVQSPKSNSDISRAGVQGLALRKVIIEKIPFFALSAADCVLTFMAQNHTGAVASEAAAPIETRLSNSILSYSAYLVKFFWPGNMAVYYPLRENASLASVGIAALVLIVITILVIIWRERWPYLAVGWFWFVGTLVPVIGLVQVGLQGMADRYTYIPYIGLSIAVIWLLADLLSSLGRREPGSLIYTVRPVVLGVLSVIALTACALGASRQVRYWQNSETLWRHTVQVTSGNAVARQNLGSALTEHGRFAEAAHEFEEALKIAPMYAEAESNFGFALFVLGKNEEAVAHYQRALAMKPIGRTHYLMAKTLMAEGKTAEAIAEYRRAIEIEPELPPALNDLAWLLAANPNPALRNGPEAVRMAEQACETTLTPTPLFVGTLAAAYAEAGRFPEAISTAERANALALQQGDTAIAQKNQELLQLYRAGKPYHEPAPDKKQFTPNH